MEIKVSFPGEMRVDANFDGLTVTTDQPESSGGQGSAPSPFDLFLASLATCAGFYMVSFMKQRGIDTTGSGVTMRAERDEEIGMTTRVVLDLSLPKGFPEKYEKAIVRAVDQCSVKRHLHEPPAIETRTIRL